MPILYVDFETRSQCNLLTKGVYNYAQDASTEVICMSYAFDEGEVITWTPGQPFPEAIRKHTDLIYAHNAAFERLIFWYVLQIDFKQEQFYCTATQARANCAPAALADVGRFTGASMRKDFRGSQLIKALCIPRADNSFNTDPVLMAEMIEYCEADILAMRSFSKLMRPLSEDEQYDYHVNERINDRGILVDVALATSAMNYADLELTEVQALVKDITNGEVTSVRSPVMREWVMARVGEQALKLMESFKEGQKKYSVDKTVRNNLLILAEENPDEVPPDVADVIQCATDIWASSTAKFKRMAQLADEEDHRVRGAFVFNGGSATGRLASYGLQLQNMTRKTAKKPLEVRDAMLAGKVLTPQFGSSVSQVLKSMIRPAIMPAKGNVFICLDWNSIEARVNPWITNHPHSIAKLDLFREGRDVYIANASATFNRTYEAIQEEYKRLGTSDQRQIGKVQELALGFSGGVGAFASMGRIYGVNMDESDAMKMVHAWRRANPWCVEHSQNVEKAYLRAMRSPGHEFSAGRVTYLYDKQHLWYALPSGRILCYPHAKLDEEGISYAKASWKPDSTAKEWPRARLWRGLAVENAVQATANDLLRFTLRQIDNIVLTAHDEILIECLEVDAEKVLAEAERIMCIPPDWCKDLPLAVEGKIMLRYGK